MRNKGVQSETVIPSIEETPNYNNDHIKTNRNSNTQNIQNPDYNPCSEIYTKGE